MPVEVQLEAAELELVCSWCGESFPAMDGPALLYALKSPCPACGGEFHLVENQGLASSARSVPAGRLAGVGQD